MSQSPNQTNQINNPIVNNQPNPSNSNPTTQHGYPTISPLAANHDSSIDDQQFDLDSVDIQQQAWLEHQLQQQKSSGKKEKGKGSNGRKSGNRGIKLDLSSSPIYHPSTSTSSYSTSGDSNTSKYNHHYDDEEEEEEEEESEIIINPLNGKPISKHFYSPISVLPIEILVQSFVRLDPFSLFNSSLVCKAWNEMIKDEATWREGFARAFGLYNPDESQTEESKGTRKDDPRVSLRRIDNKSWRGEYWRRTDLARRWKKSRTPTVLSDPRISTVEAFAFSREHHFMLSASVTYGVASRSDPFSGKVTKGFLDATGLINGLGIGNPNVEFSPDVTCVSIDSDTSRILWGFRNGLISLTTLNRQGTSPRGNIKSFKFSIPGINRGSHLGEVRCISTPFGTNQGNGRNGGGCGGSKSSMRNRERLRRNGLSLGDKISTFATAGQDGSVRIWKEGRIEPIWIGWAREDQNQDATSLPNVSRSSSNDLKPISTLEYDASEGIIVAGNGTGDLFLWYGIDISGLMDISPQVLEPLPSSEVTEELEQAKKQYQEIQASLQFVYIPNSTDDLQPIKHLVLDLKSDPEKDISVLAHKVGSKVFSRHTIKLDSQNSNSDTTSPIVSTTVFGSSASAEISTIRADFDFEDASSSKGVGMISMTSSPARSPQFGPQKSRKASWKGGAKVGPSLSSEPSTLVLGPSTSTLIDSQKGRGAYYERKFVITGTKDGRTMIWDWESEGEIYRETTQRKWQSQSNVESSKPNLSYGGAAAGQASSSSVSTSIELIKGDRQVSPSILFPRHTNSITSLEVTPSFIITGSSDGIIKIYDSLTTQLIRTINDRAAKNAASRLLASGNLSEEDASRFIVRQIVASDETLVASIGHQTLAWRAENIITSRSSRKNASSANGVVNGSRTPSKINASKRFDAKYEGLVQLKRDLLESEELIEKEREIRNHSYEKMLLERKFGRGSEKEDELNGLNEQEALEYALMISRDEEEAKKLDQALNESLEEEEEKKNWKGKGKGTEDPELQEALKQIEIAERKERHQKESPEREEVEDQSISLDNLDESDWPSPSISNASLSPSPSPLSSPILNGINTTPSRAMEILNASGKNSSFSSRNTRTADYGRAFGSQGKETNDKVRTVSVSTSSRSHSNLTSPRFEPSSNYSRNANNDIAPLDLNSPDHWPEVSSPNRRSPNGNQNSPLNFDSRSLSPTSFQSNSFSRRGSSNQRIAAGTSPSFSSLSSSMNNSPYPPSSPSPIANSSSSGRKPSLSGAWGNGSPSFRAASSGTTSSLLGRSLSQAGGGSRSNTGSKVGQEEEMDEDMKFAIELSLAEERSRLEEEKGVV